MENSTFEGDCGQDMTLWLRLQLSAIHCVRKVIIRPKVTSGTASDKFKLNKVNVILLNTEKDTESLCGILSLKKADGGTLNKTDNLHYTDCGNMCGDAVELRLSLPQEEYSSKGCIHVKEVMVFMECPLGHYREKNEGCVRCPLGEYNGNGGSVCVQCPEGSQPNDAQTACGKKN